MNKIVEYVKAHPWTVGILVVLGGLVFFKLSGWFGGGSTVAASGPSGPSEAAQIQMAGIQASKEVATLNAQVKMSETTIGAKLQETLATIGAMISGKQIDAQLQATMANINSNNQNFAIQNQTALDIANLDYAYQNNVVNSQANLAGKQIDTNLETTKLIIDALKPDPVVATPVADSDPWGSYLRANPDLLAESYRVINSDSGQNTTQTGFKSAQDYAQWHYSNFGAAEGRLLN